MYNPILEKEEAKKYHSMDWQDKKKYRIKFRKKYIRKLLDDIHRPTWKDTEEKEYKNLGALAEWLILDYISKQNTEDIRQYMLINENLKKEIKKLKSEIK